MESPVLSAFLPAAIALVMAGLGLTLTVGDFTRLLRQPRAALLALACQMVVLPLVCVALIAAFGIRGLPAVGMMLLVASPGGSLANVFSHLADGDVALNVTLTAINSVLAVVTMPLIVMAAIAGYLGERAGLAPQPLKFLQIVLIVLVPVAAGMWVRHRFPAWTGRTRTPVTVLSVVVLALVVLVAVVTQWPTLTGNVVALGPAVLLLNLLSLGIGYLVPRLARVGRRQCIASAMETGLHNGTLAIALAISVLGDATVAVPAVLYSAIMPIPALLCALVFAGGARPAPRPAVA